MIKKWLLLLWVIVAVPLCAAELPYDENADARADLQHALAQAKHHDKKVLVVFGANWCPECRRLDKEIAQNKTAIDKDKFVIVKVDVGHFDKNTNLTKVYGNVTKKGIPAAVILTADNQVEYQGRLSHLTSPYKRYLKPAFYLTLVGGTALLVLGGFLYWQRKRKAAKSSNT